MKEAKNMMNAGIGEQSIVVSIIIPTHNRKDKLLSLLDALEDQSCPAERYEIIIVDDGSVDGTEESIRPRLNSHCNVIYLKQKNQGQSIARNYGITEARGEILGFIDDDCQPDREWISNALGYFNDPTVGGLQGMTYCDPRAISPLTMQVRNLDDGNYETCNIFYRRAILQEIGPFDPVLRFYREDTDLAWRVLDLGYKIPFAENVKVEHPPHHYTIWQLLKKRYKFKWSYYDRYFEKKHPRRFRGLKMVGLFTPSLVAYYPVYFSFIIFLGTLFLPGSCPLAIFTGLVLLISVYLSVCLIYINEMARGIRFDWIMKKPEELLLFIGFWWMIMAEELVYHLIGSIKFKKFSP